MGTRRLASPSSSGCCAGGGGCRHGPRPGRPPPRSRWPAAGPPRRREPGRAHLAEHVTDEIAAALTLTGRSADRLLTVASGLARLPDVHAGLAQGGIDWAKAGVFADELAPVEDDVAAEGIAARFLGRAGAGGWTTGQLRAALRRAVLAVDPHAADRRRAEARRDADVRAWDEASGNAALAGRELPPAEVLAADARLTALAKWLQRHGAAGTISQLRAAVYTALLNGRPVESLLADLAANVDSGQQDAASRDTACGDAAAEQPANGETGSGEGAASASEASYHPAASMSPPPGGPVPAWPAVSGTIHLTMPVSALLGGGEPGEVAGHGPVDATVSRELAAMLGHSTATRWCLTVTGAGGRAAGHACAARGPARDEPAIKWAAGLRAKLQMLEQGSCSHARQSAGYRPPNILQHLIRVRQRTCSYPGLPAARRPLRPGPYGAVRPGRPVVRVQYLAVVQASPSVQAGRRMAAHPAQARRDDLANTQRPRLSNRRRPLLTSTRSITPASAGQAEQCFGLFGMPGVHRLVRDSAAEPASGEISFARGGLASVKRVV